MNNRIVYEEYKDFPEKGVNFIDLTPSILDVGVREELVANLIKLYFEDVNNIKLDYIVSPDARGFIWGGMVASMFKLGFIPVRKPGKLPEGALLGTVDYKTEYSVTSLCMPKVDIQNKRLLFVDDVYATGGTYKAIKELVEKNGGILIGGSVVVDIELNRDKEVKSLVKVRELKKGL